MQCKKCKQEIPKVAKFCPGCGEPVGNCCPGCGRGDIPDAARFCPDCGVELTPNRNEAGQKKLPVRPSLTAKPLDPPREVSQKKLPEPPPLKPAPPVSNSKEEESRRYWEMECQREREKKKEERKKVLIALCVVAGIFLILLVMISISNRSVDESSAEDVLTEMPDEFQSQAPDTAAYIPE